MIVDAVSRVQARSKQWPIDIVKVFTQSGNQREFIFHFQRVFKENSGYALLSIERLDVLIKLKVRCQRIAIIIEHIRETGGECVRFV